MPFPTPSYPEIYARVTADLEARVSGADARLRRSMLDVFARAQTYAFWTLYGFLGWISRQILVDTADTELLDRLAGIWSTTRRAAVAAQFNITITGTSGVVVPAGARFQRADGAEFTANADGTISGGTLTLGVTAVLAGEAGNTQVSTALKFVSPVSGAQSPATATATVLVSGADEQTDDELRESVLSRIQSPPQGGAEHDYVRWAKETPGVTRAWASSPDEGEVLVYFVRDDDGSGSAIIPSAGEVTVVQDYLDALRPIGLRNFTVAAPTAAVDAFTVHTVPDTAAIRSAIEAELDDLYRRKAEPGATILRSQILEAVSRAAGENDNSVTVPSGDISHTSSQMPIRGVVTFV